MRSMFIVAPVLLACVMPANASHHHRSHDHFVSREYGSRRVELPHPRGCPRTSFCGCGAAVRLFGHPVRGLDLARNWFRFPSARPAPGMVGVREHHIFVIEALMGGGRALVYNANGGGHRTYLAVRSLAGFSIRNPRSRL